MCKWTPPLQEQQRSHGQAPLPIRVIFYHLSCLVLKLPDQIVVGGQDVQESLQWLKAALVLGVGPWFILSKRWEVPGHQLTDDVVSAAIPPSLRFLSSPFFLPCLLYTSDAADD